MVTCLVAVGRPELAFSDFLSLQSRIKCPGFLQKKHFFTSTLPDLLGTNGCLGDSVVVALMRSYYHGFG